MSEVDPIAADRAMRREKIQAVCEDIGASDGFTAAALDIADAALEATVKCGVTPDTWAAAVVYAAVYLGDEDREHHRQAVIAESAGVTEMAVRNHYRDIISGTVGGPGFMDGRVRGNGFDATTVEEIRASLDERGELPEAVQDGDHDD